MAAGDMPKYLVIADSLRARIEAGEYEPGERLPSQQSMAAEFEVTVMTLRQALAQLEGDGLIRAFRGRGTFVTQPPAVRFGLDHLWSFAQEMSSQGIEVHTTVLAVDTTPSGLGPDAARRALDSDAVVEVVRRRSIDGTAVVLQRSYMTAATWGQVDGDTLGRESMYAVLERSAGHTLERASEVFRATTLNGADAELLAASPGDAAMESFRTSFDSDDRAFLFDRAQMLGSATEIRAERTADSMRLGYGTP